MMLDTFDIIICIVLAGVCISLVMRTVSLRRRIQAMNADMESKRQLILLGNISNEHVKEENLQQANKNVEMAIRKGTGISHFDCEVRPMLEQVIQSTKRIIDSNISEEERRELSLSISREVKKLSDLVENVLLMARIDSKRIQYSIEETSVQKLVMELYEEYNIEDGSRFSSKETGGCKLSVIEGRPSLSIKADGLYLKKALREIIKNAYTFSRKGDIFIGWFYRLGSDEVEIFVEDNGMGISPESQQHVFEIFYKENNTKGMGVGLSISKELVESMGGRVLLASRPNVGTRVSVLFPLA